MTHVLLVDHSQTGTVGGALTGLIHLMRGLDPHRYRSTLVLYEPKNLGAMLDGAHCRVIALDAGTIHRPAPGRSLGDSRTGRRAQAWRTLGAARRLVQQKIPRARMLLPVLRRERPDVIHAGNSLLQNLDVVLAARWAGIPCVVHEKGLLRYTLVERLCARSVGACICMTEAIRANLARERMRIPRTVVVHDGIDLEGFRPRQPAAAMRAALGVGDCDPVIGITANVNPWKGQDVLVRAVAELVADFPRLGCLVVGGIVRGADEYLRGMEAFIASRRLEKHVRFVGARSDIADIVGALDVLVHASTRPEPFGRVLIEGMALGKPIVATAGGGVPEIVVDGETGLLVPQGDVGAMAAALRRLLGDAALRDRFGAAGARRAREHFSLGSYVPGVEAVYAAVLAGAARPAAAPAGRLPGR
jgi:glycosyltransferase involved in cell wall biosynthesis